MTSMFRFYRTVVRALENDFVLSLAWHWPAPRHRMVGRCALLACATLALLFFSAGAAQANDIIVDEPDDSVGATGCTLREAVTAANTDSAVSDCTAGSGADTITFDAGLAGSTITLAGSQLDLTSNLTITASGVISVSGNNASRVFDITSSGVVTLTGLTIRDGWVSGNFGGGIRNDGGALLLASSSVVSSTTNIRGGGIYQQAGGRMTIDASTVVSNTSVLGGGIYNSDAGSVLTLINGSVVRSNSASSSGGGIQNSFGGHLIIDASTVASNMAPFGGGIDNSSNPGYTSTVTITNGSLVQANIATGGGGGILNSGDGSTATIVASTVSSNTASGGPGGGIWNSRGRVTIDVSTVASNTAMTSGGGIFNQNSGGALTVTNSSILNNTAGTGSALYEAGGASNVTGSCIVNNSNTAVDYGFGTAIIATGNWWGHASGPSGAGPGVGDSVSSNVDFSGFLDAAILGCPTFADAEVGISKVVTPTLVTPGQALTYTLTVSNTGARFARNVVISDSVPVSVTISDVTSSTFGSGVAITQTSGSPDFAWVVNQLDVGEGVILTLTGAVTASPAISLAGQIITNTAIITAAGDLTADNNSSSASPYRLCGPGTYLETTTNQCTEAPPGFYVPDFGYTSPLACVPGSYQPNSGASSCLPAPVNTFVDSQGATSPTPCPVDTYNPVEGATSVAACLPALCYATADDGATHFSSLDADAVQLAIDAANSGDTVKVAGVCTGVRPRAYSVLGVTGVYSQTGYISTTLTLLGGYTVTDWATSDPVNFPTVLDGDASGQVLVIDAGVAVTVSNLEVTNGYAGADADTGGGISVYTATVTVSNTQVYSNYATTAGGGLGAVASVVTVVDSAFHGNLADCFGGGIGNISGHMVIQNSRIYTNTASCEGGGAANLSYDVMAWMTMTNGSRVEDNIAGVGGGLYNEDGNVVIDGSTIAANVADAGGGIVNFGISGEQDVTIRNGATVARNYADSFAGGIFNIDGNITIDASQVVSNTACCIAGGVYVLAGTATATLTVQNGSSISYNSVEGDGGGIYSQDAWVVVDDSEIAWNQGSLGGGIYQDSCSCIESRILITNSSVIQHNHARDDGSGFGGEGGGVFNDYGHFIVVNSTVYSNTADQDGGGISSLDFLTVTNSIISENVSLYNDGGGLDPDGPTWIYSTTIADNRAGENGGGLDIDGDTVIENSLIIRNTAGISPSLDPADGGGIHHYDGSLVITGTQILSNSAPVAGGGIYADWDITLINSLVQGNRADLGGGVYVDWYGLAAFDGVQVISNTAVISGGGVFLDDGSLAVQGSDMIENAAQGDGGGFYSTGASNTLAITATRIISNTAGNGGALFQADGTTNVNASCIVANRAVAVNYAGGTTLLDATYNWWGHPSGPSGVAGGMGDSVSDDVDYAGSLPAAILGCPTLTFPELAIDKVVHAPYVPRDGAITYTLTFSNGGDGIASGVIVSDSVPLSITVTGVASSTTGAGVLITQTSGGPLPSSGADFAWLVNKLAAGESGIITITGMVSGAVGTVITNTTTITAPNDSAPANNSASAVLTIVQLDVYPAQPGVLPNTTVTISATVRPPQAGLSVNFAIVSGGGTPNNATAATDSSGVATMTYTAPGASVVVQIDGELAVAPLVRDRGTLFVAVATSAGGIEQSASGVYTVGNLSPNYIQIVKQGAGTPILGWAEFAGNPCPASSPGTHVVSPYVDAMVEDATGVNEIVVTLKYTGTTDASLYKPSWCDNGTWKPVTAPLAVETGTLVFTITGSTSPTILQLEGTPFVGVGGAPTAVTVGDFAAERQPDRVRLTWQTLSEVGVYGFHLYRGLDAVGSGERITVDPVRAQGLDSLQGFDYAYDDLVVPSAEAPRYYWLEELHSDGGAVRHGPVRVGGVLSQKFYLPAVMQATGAAAAQAPGPEAAPEAALAEQPAAPPDPAAVPAVAPTEQPAAPPDPAAVPAVAPTEQPAAPAQQPAAPPDPSVEPPASVDPASSGESQVRLYLPLIGQ